ncbi:MAG: MBL fold metallo-hydrolase [Steroidobacteraceae bacterium]
MASKHTRIGAKLITVAGIGALALMASAQEATRRQPVSAYPTPTEFPNQNQAAVNKYLAKARRIAGDELFPDFIHRCIISPRYPVRVRGIQFDGLVEPTKLFDQLYSVGQNAVSSHALVTSAGIVLFDTLNSPEEAEKIIVPNLRRVGLDPKNIKYIVVTHGHGDHYGGARYLQQTYGARVLSSAIDWDMMASEKGNGPFAGLEPPKRDMVIEDGQALVVGDTTLRFYITPGHTPGTLSTIFPVTDKGQPHLVGLHGGTGGGRDIPGLQAGIKSYVRWREITSKAGVDVLVANHPLHDRGIENNELLRARIPGQANPYILGRDRYQKYMQVMETCSRVHLARLGGKE